jgi:VanZ family protein
LIKVILAVLWTAFIISALVRPPAEIPRFEWLVYPGADKAIHAILFFVEAALLRWSFSEINRKKQVVFIIIFCALLGGGLELVQHQFVEGRSGDAFDFIADVVGALAALWLSAKLKLFN